MKLFCFLREHSTKEVFDAEFWWTLGDAQTWPRRWQNSAPSCKIWRPCIAYTWRLRSNWRAAQVPLGMSTSGWWPSLRWTEASATGQYCILSLVLSLLMKGKGTSAGGIPPQIICLSKRITREAWNSPVPKGADCHPLVLSSVLWVDSTTPVTLLLPPSVHLSSHCYQVMCQHV